MEVIPGNNLYAAPNTTKKKVNQNRRQQVFNGEVCVSAGGLCVRAGGLDILKIGKNSTHL